MSPALALRKSETAREYLRVSQIHDPRRPDRSPEEQHADNERAAGRHGWTLGAAYRDVGSASRYGRKVREDFGRLVADLEHDRFGADVLILWESSRGSRKVSEWVNLIELCEERGVRIYVTSDSRLYDPAEPRDRRSLLEDAVDAEYESAKTRKRVQRARAAEALAGRPHGRVPYGYRRVYDPATGRPKGQVIDDDEAAVVREIYTRLHAGHSLKAIARDFGARGVTTRSGKPWTYNAIREFALTPTPAGVRHYRGQELPGDWPAIVDRSLWLAVTRMLTAPERLTGRPGRAVHLLSMIARCDVCGGPMSYRGPMPNHAEPTYRCMDGNCVRVGYATLDAYVEQVITAYLTTDGNLDALTHQPADPAAAEQAEAEVQAIRRELEQLGDELGTGAAAALVKARALPQIEARLQAAEARRDELNRPAALRGLLPADSRRRTVVKWWHDAPLTTKREALRYLCSPAVLGDLRITRAVPRYEKGRRGAVPVPVHERVIWRRAE